MTLATSMTSSRVTRDDSGEMTCGAGMTGMTATAGPGAPGPLYLVQLRPPAEGKIHRDCWSCHCQGGPEIPDLGGT